MRNPATVLRRLCLLVAVACGNRLQAQTGSVPLALPRLSSPVRVDGRLDESAWAAVPALPFTMFTPGAGGPPGESSDVRMAHDDVYLYVAARFGQRQGDLRVSSLTRDQLGADDYFRVLIDSYDDNENAVVFATNPAGVQLDLAIGRDGADVNDSWNTFWDVATARDSDGWSAEFRIPLSSLRFQVVQGSVTMGVIVARYTARRNELDTWPALDPRSANAPLRPSGAATVTLTGIQSRTPVYLTPYVLGGGAWTPVAGGTTAWRTVGEATAEVGLDIKAPLSSNLTLDLTANTDFAQVEADDEQVNLTRFSLFFPEKRQFFLERTGVFAVRTGAVTDPSQLFHSRRLGLDDGGQPLRIFGGARLVGRAGAWDIGLLNLHTEDPSGPGSENFGVLRVRRRVLNPQSNAGVTVTARTGGRGGDNFAFEADTRLRVAADDYLTVQAAAVAADATGRGEDAGMVRIALERPSTLSSQGFAYEVALKHSGAAFDPGIGFQPRRGYGHAVANVRYGFFPGAGSALRVIQPSAIVSAFRRNADRVVESAFSALFLNYEFRSGVNGWIGGSRATEDLLELLSLGGGAAVAPGRYEYNQVEFALFPNEGSAVRFGIQGAWGEFYDGRTRSLFLGAAWNPSAHLEVSGGVTRQAVTFASRPASVYAADARATRIDPDLGQLRATVALDARVSLNVLVQYNRLADEVAGNARLRYRFGEGRDLYVVFNERLTIDPRAAAPGLAPPPHSQGRTLLLKYTHTLTR